MRDFAVAQELRAVAFVQLAVSRVQRLQALQRGQVVGHHLLKRIQVGFQLARPRVHLVRLGRRHAEMVDAVDGGGVLAHRGILRDIAVASLRQLHQPLQLSIVPAEGVMLEFQLAQVQRDLLVELLRIAPWLPRRVVAYLVLVSLGALAMRQAQRLGLGRLLGKAQHRADLARPDDARHRHDLAGRIAQVQLDHPFDAGNAAYPPDQLDHVDLVVGLAEMRVVDITVVGARSIQQLLPGLALGQRILEADHLAAGGNQLGAAEVNFGLDVGGRTAVVDFHFAAQRIAFGAHDAHLVDVAAQVAVPRQQLRHLLPQRLGLGRTAERRGARQHIYAEQAR